MQSENAIEVKHVSKKFKVYLDKGHTLKEKILFSGRRKYEERNVLKDISFDVKKGEAIGLIGHNGCGKSTTLKLLTRIMYPDAGTIEMRGRVSSLIELGAGFHPDMSGRQNIYTNAAIFGLTRKEIELRLDDIIDFSELEDFIDNPVRTYSSGMYMRLAFSVAINVDAEILLIDEILAVGDANFQTKCFNKLREIKTHGTTIVIVSHSLGQIEQICEKSIWIHDGRVQEEGNPYDVHSQYLKYMAEKRQDIIEKESKKRKDKSITKEDKTDVIGEKKEEKHIINKSEKKQEILNADRWGKGDAKITSVIFCTQNNEQKSVFALGENVIIKIEYNIKKVVKDAVIGFSFSRNDGIYCYGVNTQIDRLQHYDLLKSGSAEILLENIDLLPGEYFLDLEIKDLSGITMDYYRKSCKLEIVSDVSDVGIFRMNHKWIL